MNIIIFFTPFLFVCCAAALIIIVDMASNIENLDDKIERLKLENEHLRKRINELKTKMT